MDNRQRQPMKAILKLNDGNFPPTPSRFIDFWPFVLMNLWLLVFIGQINTSNQNYEMAAQIFNDSKFTGVRLPTDVRPVHYKVKLTPSFDDFTFAGTVEIQLEGDGAEATNSIVLHSSELKILNGHLDDNALKSVTYSEKTETATLEFENDINPNGSLRLNFTGILNDKMRGFYRTAVKIGNETVYAATTKFEPTHARRAIPCWEEPAIKATFSITLVADMYLGEGKKKYKSILLSNMDDVRLEYITEARPKIEVEFSETPMMSTYLVAFIVGPFEMIKGTDGRRPIRVYTPPGKKEQGRFALDVACKSLRFFEDYFGIEYPLPKMDLIAIPDFAAGAMENWGLVTFRETALLVDEGNTSTHTKQAIATVVAHELAHQWFGNLVTMEWWTHLWLNEGFASFMEFLCVDHIFPEYDIWSQFVTLKYTPAMALDSLHSSHPIEVRVEHPSEIDEIFDSITYKKGASILRMLYTYIGDTNFRKGMKDYLTKFAYKNASTEDLWDALQRASKMPIRKLMSRWTSQKGYPWLEVGYAKEHKYSVRLTLKQDKFSADGKVLEDESVLWWIPISIISASFPDETEETFLLTSRSSERVIHGVGDSWVKLNPGTIGLYRTAYPEEMTTKLFSAISNKTLPPMDRLGIQNDFCALCQAGHESTVNLLKLLQAFKDEDDYTVWTSIDSCLGRLGIILSYTDYKEKFQDFGRELYRDIFRKLTWTPRPNEKHTDALTRALVLNRLVSFGSEQVISEALKRYEAHLDKTTPIPADLRGAVYRAVSAYGDDELFESLFDLYKTAELQEEKGRVAHALGFSQSSDRLKEVVEFAFTDDVRNQDKLHFLTPIGVSNPSIAWKVLQDNKDLFRGIYESGHLMAHLIGASTRNFASEKMAQEVASFFEKNKFLGAERTIQQSLETIRLNAEWLARDADNVRRFLTANRKFKYL